MGAAGKKPAKKGGSRPSAAPARSRAAASATIRNDGQLQLTRLTGSLGAIAKRVGTTKQSISEWRRGEKTPSSEARLKVQAAYGIDPGAWDVQPGGAVTEVPPTTPDAGPRTALGEAEATLHAIRKQLNRPKLLVSEVVRLREAEMKAIRLRASLERDQALLEDRMVREHPAWRRIRAVIVRFVQRLPPADRDELLAELARAEGAA